MKAALGELHRALRPGGRVVVWDIDWPSVSWHSTAPARMQRVLAAWDAHLTHPALPRTLAPLLRSVGFDDVAAERHAFGSIELGRDTFVGGVLPLITDFVAGREEIGEEEARDWAAEQGQLADRGEFYFSCTQVCFSARRP